MRTPNYRRFRVLVSANSCSTKRTRSAAEQPSGLDSFSMVVSVGC